MLRDLVFDEFTAALRPGLQVGLVGGLGAGKTTFAARVLRYLGVNEAIMSPSFGLCHEYQVRLPGSGVQEMGEGLCLFEHWDLYRLSALPDEVIFYNESEEGPVIRFIEWSDKFPDLDQNLDIKIFFEVHEGEGGELQRRILW